MTQKVELTKEQARAMDSIMEQIDNPADNLVFENKCSVIQYKLEQYGFCGVRSKADSIPHDKFILALYNGYIVPKTAEELADEVLAEKYTKAVELELDDTTPHSDYGYLYSRAFADGVEFVLDTKGIKVEGINK
ncbi:hypothetical protein M4D68_00750 [Priestia aryabhattai]|uniref:hypothetical protein n=1 Tax=Priestia aryabhattai TaxID=412384 RepID=UPI00203AFE7D|nr:hypothetical protein [Priestia aryabhattai]MCM3639675.1 hypothetical protein [Priestia aryabhattai]